MSITNALGETVYQGITGGNGLIEIAELPAYHVQSDSGNWLYTDYGPYTISVTYGGVTSTQAVQLNESPTDFDFNF